MLRFPKSQAQIAALAEQLWRGLLDNNAIFSQPPVHPILIRIRKIIYQSRHEWHCHGFCDQSEGFALLYVKQVTWGIITVSVITK